MVSINDIQEKIARDLKIIFPNIKRVSRESIRELETPCLSIQLVFYNAPVIHSRQVLKTVEMDLIYYAKSDKKSEGYSVMDRFNSWLALGLPVKDRFIKTAEEPTFSFVDNDLHYLITFQYFDDYAGIFVTDNNHIAEFEDDGEGLENIIEEEGADRENDLGTIDNNGEEIGDIIVDENNEIKQTLKKMKELEMFFEI